MTAVANASDVHDAVVPVRRFMRDLGVSTHIRVPVTLISPDQLAWETTPGALGYTQTQRVGDKLRFVEVRIMAGLPRTMFAGVLAHEAGHAWLAACPQIGRSSAVEEGICELLRSWWLRHVGDKLAELLLRAMDLNPDPVYGGGYRQVKQLVGPVPQAELVRRLTATGRLA